MLEEKSVFIASYCYLLSEKTEGDSYLSGPSEDLFAYLIPRCKEAAFLRQPLSDSIVSNVYLKRVHKGVLKDERVMSFFNALHRYIAQKASFTGLGLIVSILYKFRDIFSICWAFFILKNKYDIFIGVESVNALTGCIMRLIGLVNIVVYDVIDYAPERFTGKLANKIFHKLDRCALRFCNVAVSQTSLIVEHRIRLYNNIRAKQVVKPSGIAHDRLEKISLSRINRHEVIYAGLVHEMDGVELIVGSAIELLKTFPDLKVRIIGDGDQLDKIKKLSRDSNLVNHIQFMGFIYEKNLLEDYLKHAAVAVAPYKEYKNRNIVKYFNDVNKPRLYLACGLPVVITKVPSVHREIHDRKAGIAIDYSQSQMVEAITKILKEDAVLEQYRENAYQMAKEYTWESIFDRMFNEIMAD
ncbi:MAG: glycosyltransferase [Nitrospirae bacterium]|nr:glycosyltransferase [Nitrospirota bacterium]